MAQEMNVGEIKKYKTKELIEFLQKEEIWVLTTMTGDNSQAKNNGS